MVHLPHSFPVTLRVYSCIQPEVVTQMHELASDSQDSNQVLCGGERCGAPSPVYPQKELEAEVPRVVSFSSLFVSRGLLQTVAYLKHKRFALSLQ